MTAPPGRAQRTLWLVRHAAPLVAPGVCYGALDVAADPQATQAAAARLAAALPRQAALYSSKLQRCEQLAKAVQGQRPDLIIKHDDRLREMDFGAWEGQPWDAIGPAALAAWADDFAHHAPGGGESVSAFMQRVAAAFDDTRAALAPEGAAAWITHAGVIRAATLIAGGVRHVSRAADWPDSSPGFGAVRVLTLVD
jgi:alpha-ribazole phosphatase